jgi:5'-3' exonuclease
MGIKHLNRFLKENCSKNSIRKIGIQQIQGKRLVIDASIYMYKYMADDALIENMYQLITILLLNNIIPLFVFDGKPPPEKYDLITKRKEVKKLAEDKYGELLLKYENTNDKNEKQNMMKEMVELKNKFVRITNKDKEHVKELLTAFGIMYYESTNEADEVCAYMVKSGKAWGCLSDDMDMFVYGCTRVLRNISLINKTVILYETPNILKELCMTYIDFKEIMVLSGTDYNIDATTSLDVTISWYSKYKSALNNIKEKIPSFYDWLLVNSDYITNIDDLRNICKLFTLEQESSLDKFEIILNKRTDRHLHNIMEKEGFIFT